LASGDDTEEDGMAPDEEKEDMRKTELEFMISLSEAKPAMVRKVDGWTAAIVRGCFEGMGDIGDNTLEVWLKADVRITGYAFVVTAYSLEADVDYRLRKIRQMTRTRMCMNSLSISSRALWAARLFPPVFKYIPSMLASYDWRLRHAGLMEIAPIGELRRHVQGTSVLVVRFRRVGVWVC
jgi:importin-5